MPYVAGMPQSRALMGGPCKNHGFNGGTLHVHVYHVTKFVFTYASRKRDQQLIKSRPRGRYERDITSPNLLTYFIIVKLPAVKPFSRQNPRYLPLNGKSAFRYFNFFFDDLFCLAKKV